MFADIASALGRGEPLALVTVVRINGAAPCAPGTRLLVHADGSLAGTLGGATTDARARDDALAALSSGETRLLTYHLDPDLGESVGSCGATLEVFVEPLRPEPRLLVLGSGYVAQALARLALPLGWRVTLMDDRSEFTREARLPEGVATQVGEFPELLAAAAPDAVSAVVIVTRGHRSDQDALRAALETPAGYIGMIGSPSKVRNIFRALLKAGVPTEQLAHVHAPIGLDLGAETPDEIALSIAAELLAWRREGSGAPLRDREGILNRLLEGRGKSDQPAAEASEETSAAEGEVAEIAPA